MSTPNDDDPIKQIGRALGDAIQAIAINEQVLSFTEAVREYKRVEEDFVARADGNAFHVLETRRRIAERILVAAHRFEQSFDICQENWNTLCTLGFTTPLNKTPDDLVLCGLLLIQRAVRCWSRGHRAGHC